MLEVQWVYGPCSTPQFSAVNGNQAQPVCGKLATWELPSFTVSWVGEFQKFIQTSFFPYLLPVVALLILAADKDNHPLQSQPRIANVTQQDSASILSVAMTLCCVLPRGNIFHTGNLSGCLG